MEAFKKLPISFDVSKLKDQLVNSSLWGEYSFRVEGNSPHRETTDIWVRYRDIKECIEKKDWSLLGEPHKAVWLKDFPEIKKISKSLMEFIDGKELGGILLTKLPSGKKVYPHVDGGWHAGYYEKYFIPIKNMKGANFCFEYGEIKPNEGEVYLFRNDINHWVVNDSSEDRISMVICIKK